MKQKSALPRRDLNTAKPCIWVLSDGKAGDELQCLGVAEALGDNISIRRVTPRKPWVWLAPFGSIDPKDAPNKPGSPLEGPFPDCVIASGRRAVPYLRAIRKHAPETFTVFLKDPRTGAKTADLIWVPQHDGLRGDNVLATITPPHRLTPEKLSAARKSGDPRLSSLPTPRVAVLIGGKSRHHDFTAADVTRLMEELTGLVESGAHLMITASRRTPPALHDALKALVAAHAHQFLWDGSGENPYLAMLALADYVVATADSFNMIGEATATGKPILVFEPSGGHKKLSAFIRSLMDYGAVHPLTARLEGMAYIPLDATRLIADRIRKEMASRRTGVLPSDQVI